MEKHESRDRKKHFIINRTLIVLAVAAILIGLGLGEWTQVLTKAVIL